jgi:hypothetical protein
MRRKRRRALRLADRPRLRQRQISWAKNEELKRELEACGHPSNDRVEYTTRRRHGYLKARENLLWIGPVPESPACAWQYISSVFFNCQINDVTFYSTRNATKKGDIRSVFSFFSLAIFRHFSTKKLGIYFYFLGFSSVISTNFSLFFGIKFRQIFYTQKMKTRLPLGSPAPPKKKD